MSSKASNKRKQLLNLSHDPLRQQYKPYLTINGKRFSTSPNTKKKRKKGVQSKKIGNIAARNAPMLQHDKVCYEMESQIRLLQQKIEVKNNELYDMKCKYELSLHQKENELQTLRLLNEMFSGSPVLTDSFPVLPLAQNPMTAKLQCPSNHCNEPFTLPNEKTSASCNSLTHLQQLSANPQKWPNGLVHSNSMGKALLKPFD